VRIHTQFGRNGAGNWRNPAGRLVLLRVVSKPLPMGLPDPACTSVSVGGGQPAMGQPPAPTCGLIGSPCRSTCGPAAAGVRIPAASRTELGVWLELLDDRSRRDLVHPMLRTPCCQEPWPSPAASCRAGRGQVLDELATAARPISRQRALLLKTLARPAAEAREPVDGGGCASATDQQ